MQFNNKQKQRENKGAFRHATLLKKDSNTVVSFKYCKNFKNTYYEEHLQAALFWRTWGDLSYLLGFLLDFYLLISFIYFQLRHFQCSISVT